MQAGLTRVIIVDYLEELTCKFDVVSVVSLLLNRVLVLLEPATDLVHQEELRFRVAEQVEQNVNLNLKIASKYFHLSKPETR